MRSRLLQSFLFVLGFWWSAAALVWSILDPEVQLANLHAILSLFPWVTASIPEHVTVLDAWNLQKQVLANWSVPIGAICVTLAVIGAMSAWCVAWREHRTRIGRVRCEGEYRGVTVSIGTLPTPRAPATKAMRLGAKDESLQRLTAQERALLTDVIGVLAAHPDAFVGEAQASGSLLQYALTRANRALHEPQPSGLATIAAAAGALGNLTAWKKNEIGKWSRIRDAQREAARALIALPSWRTLPPTERLTLVFAIKYQLCPADMPRLPSNPGATAMALRLIEQLARIEEEDHSNTATQSAPIDQIQEEVDPRVRLLEVFERELATMPFQTPRLPKNTPAVGWRKGTRAYLLENRLIDCLLPRLPPDLRAKFAPSGAKKRVEPLTAALLELFHAEGWLLLAHESFSVTADAALWVILAGKLEFSRVIIVDLPQHMLDRLPAANSHYDVAIERPYFQSPQVPSISKKDLMGDVLRPKSVTTN